MGRVPKILIIERDANSRRLIATALAHDFNAEVSETESGYKGLARLAEDSKFDLIIVDPADPVANSLRLIESLRARAPSSRILVLSVVFHYQSVARAMEQGANDYLQKPVDLEDLRQSVQLLLRQRGEPAPDAAPTDTSSSTRMKVRTQNEGMFVELTAPTGSLHIDRFQNFIQRLLAANLDKAEYLALRLALEETLSNASEWGNRFNRMKDLKLSYCWMPDRVTFRIEDQGKGFRPEAVPDPARDPLAHLQRRKAEGKRIGGWGLLLTRNSVDEINFNKQGNVVFLTKYLKTGKASAKKRSE